MSFADWGRKKKGMKKKSLHIFRRTSWETLAQRTNWRLHYCMHHSTKFFSYEVFDFGDLGANNSYRTAAPYIRVLSCVFSVRVNGDQEANENEVTASTSLLVTISIQ